jgi:predicted RNA-binding Zn-ribbon protein involved in translation (DUF1610 family)
VRKYKILVCRTCGFNIPLTKLTNIKTCPACGKNFLIGIVESTWDRDRRWGDRRRRQRDVI